MSATEPIDTRTFPLDHAPVDEWQRIAPVVSTAQTGDAEDPERTGADPTTALAELGTIGGTDYGLWEMSFGAMRDVEGDEVFVVLSGTGRIDFDEPARESIDLAPGVLVRLAEGMRTRWHIDDVPLRKLFIAPSEE